MQLSKYPIGAQSVVSFNDSDKKSQNRLKSMLIGVTAALWGTSATAQNPQNSQSSQKPRVVRENKCKVEIESGDFKIGENVVFSTPSLATEVPPQYKIKILKRTKKKLTTWVGLVDKESTKDCSQTVESTLDDENTSKSRRVSFRSEERRVGKEC